MITRAQFLIGLAAGTGGIAPNLVNLAQGFIGQNPNIPGWLYYVGVAIFFVLGAAVALIFSETDHRKAFFLGVSLPAFIAAAQTQSVPKIPTVTPNSESAFLSIFPSAYAQAPAASASAPTLAPEGSSTNTVKLKVLSGCVQCELWFFDAEGKLVERKVVPFLTGTSKYSVPAGATKFGVWNYKINPSVIAIPKVSADKATTYEFGFKYNPWNDLKRGLGNFDVRPYDAQLKVVETDARTF